MKKYLTFVAMLFAMSNFANAQNSLSIVESTIPQNGGNLAIHFSLAEADVYTSYQFKIETPDGIEYVMDADNDVACVLDAGHDASHMATAHWNASIKTLTIGVASMKSALLKGLSCEILIPVKETSAEVGETFDFTITGLTLIRQTGVKDVLEDVNFTMTIAAPVDHRVVLDENATDLPKAASGVDVRVKRTINAGEWSTLVLPFDMTEAQVYESFGNDVQLAEFMDYEANDDLTEIVVTFDDARLSEDGLMANNPYIIKTSMDITEFTVDDVTIDPDEEGAVAEYTNGKTGSRKVVYGSFIGTYHAQTVVPSNCLFLSGNQFWYSTGLTKMKAFRAYFDFEDVLSSIETAGARVAIIMHDETTGIESMDIDHSTFNNEHYYDLQGRRVLKPSKGLYIKNGKKEVVK